MKAEASAQTDSWMLTLRGGVMHTQQVPRAALWLCLMFHLEGFEEVMERRYPSGKLHDLLTVQSN